jgi:hypothetical protein
VTATIAHNQKTTDFEEMIGHEVTNLMIPWVFTPLDFDISDFLAHQSSTICIVAISVFASVLLISL